MWGPAGGPGAHRASGAGAQRLGLGVLRAQVRDEASLGCALHSTRTRCPWNASRCCRSDGRSPVQRVGHISNSKSAWKACWVASLSLWLEVQARGVLGTSVPLDQLICLQTPQPERVGALHLARTAPCDSWLSFSCRPAPGGPPAQSNFKRQAMAHGCSFSQPTAGAGRGQKSPLRVLRA